jgi:hypothetical protein
MLLITDAAINMAPDARTKADIVQNAIDLAHVLGIERAARGHPVGGGNRQPRHPVHAGRRRAVQDGRPRQITGGCSTGRWPSTTRSRGAARRSRRSCQGGRRADILLVPDLESGNMLAKQLEYLAGADSAGIVLGARCPSC